MTLMRHVLSATRWVLALSVAYGSIHVAAGTLTRLVLDFEQLVEVDHAAPVLALIGLANLVAAFGLVTRAVSLQALSAVVLVMSSPVPRAGIPATAVSGVLVVAATVFALII